ncbi:MAG TPA: alpha/beta hydrolase [Acidimicrobiales bacterium]
MPLDPCFKTLLESMPPPQPGADPVAAARAGTEAMFVHPSAPPMRTEDRAIPGPAGAIPVRVYTPDSTDSAPRGVLVYFHGGGFVAGSIASHDGTVRELAAGAGCIAVSVEYRLAPEHPYPAAFEDCVAALDWVFANAPEIGGDPARVAIGGDSAGGNLCAAVALHNRDRGGPKLAFQLLVYPVIDPACDTSSMHDNGTGFMLRADAMRWMWEVYAGSAGVDENDPYLCPVAAKDLSGLPPTLVITAELDPLRDEGEAYARRLQEAGVPTRMSRYDGQIHGFFSMYALAPQARVAADEAARALREALQA